MALKIEIKDLYWVAGIIEGEGTIYTGHNGCNPRIVVKVAMTDEDVIKKLMHVTGIGYTGGQTQIKGQKKVFRWEVNGQKNTAALLMTIYPLMSNRRQEQIRKALEAWKSFPYGRVRPKEKDEFEWLSHL